MLKPPTLRDILEHLLAEVYGFWPCSGSLLAVCLLPHRKDAFELCMRWKLGQLSRDAALYRRHYNQVLGGVYEAMTGMIQDSGRASLVLLNTYYKRNAPRPDFWYRGSSESDDDEAPAA